MSISAAQIVSDIHAELALPQSAGQRVHNPRPTLDQLRQALEGFLQPHELANTRVESYLINMRLIERHITPAQLTARNRRTHGDFAKRYWKLTPRGYFFWRDLHNRILPVPVPTCRALVPYAQSAQVIYHDRLLRAFGLALEIVTCAEV